MFDFSAQLKQRFAALQSSAPFFSLRYVKQTSQHLSVRKNVAEPPQLSIDEGAMLTVRVNGVEAYAATNDISQRGLQTALEQAEIQARQLAPHSLLDLRDHAVATARADYLSPNLQNAFPSLSDCYALLNAESASVPRDERLVNWQVSLGLENVEQIYLNNAGAEIRQAQRFVFPGLTVTAYDGQDSQTRSLGRENFGQQGGAEVIASCGIIGAAVNVADQALQLVMAPNTPTGPRDLLLTPDQMTLQIHESIGHPLELDRILGDERNYAGTSFVKASDFGSLQYGSSLLNVTFDPEIPEQLASYGHDDDGTPASKQFLIKDGVLVRPLGGALSQYRSGMEGVANSRASSWNRAPIDRMANLNIEPGDQSMAQLIGWHRARHFDEHQPLVVDRRCAQQIPVRLRVGPADRERRDQGRGEKPQLPRDLRPVLAQPQRGRRCQHLQGPRHAQLWQRRAQSSDPRGACLARLRVRER